MKTIVNFILDKSGSMETCKDETIIGFNKYVQTLKKKAKKGTMQFSLTLFDTVITKPYIAVDISKVKPLNVETYNPNGWTALYDAAVDTIEAVSAKVDKMKEKTAVLTVIMTDGMENSSTKHNQDCLKDLVSKLKKEGKSEDSAKAIAASAGRKKYGKSRFQEMAAAGRSKKEMGGMAEELEMEAEESTEMMEMNKPKKRKKINASAAARKRGNKARSRQKRGKTGCFNSGDCMDTPEV